MKRLVRWRIEGETLVDEADEERSLDITQEVMSGLFDKKNPSGGLDILEAIYDTVTDTPEIEMLSSELVDRGNK